MKSAFILAVIAALLVSTYAYCPNLCSGHGTCTNEDKCSCYTQKGTDGGGASGSRVAWTGPDCSLRTCPISSSFAGGAPDLYANQINIDTSESALQAHSVTTQEYSGIGEFAASSASGYYPPTDTKRGSEIILASALDSTISYTLTVYKVSTFTYASSNDGFQVFFYEPVPTAVSTAIGNGDTYVLKFPKKGDGVFNSRNPPTVNGVHAKLECSGQGICNRESGNCECFAGYGGEACTRTVCPSDCSGHGTCKSIRALASEASDEMVAIKGDNAGTRLNNDLIKVYGGWDAEKEFGCKCDSGYRGPACDMVECPSFTDPMWGCGGGPCNAATSTSGNYILDLSTETVQNTAGIDTSLYTPCQADSRCTTNEQRDCSGRGLCDYSTGLCSCFSGFYGEACHIQTILV